MHNITVTDHKGRTSIIHISPERSALSIAQWVYTHGEFPPPALCSGLGRCGKCRMLFTTNAPLPKGEDALFFNEAELQEGWRLACHHYPEHGMCITIPEVVVRRTLTAGLHTERPCKLAVDLGTTSLHWSLLDGTTRILGGQELNPQLGAGSEVMSRLAFAHTAEGAASLQSLVLERLKDIIRNIAVPIDACCIAGNSVMTALLLGKNISGLSAAPYRLEYYGGSVETLPDLPPVYIPPLPAPFVGGDLSAGMTAVQQMNPDYPFILADLGTNGEFVLALSPDKALITSVALGPALEGIGLTFGTVAQSGVITRFTLTPKGLTGSMLPPEVAASPGLTDTTHTTAGKSIKPHGISGTGYLSLVHTLLKVGLLEQDGRFASAPYPPLAARLADNLTVDCGEKRLMLDNNLYLSATDIEELLKVKAAFTLAYERLLKEAELTPKDIKNLYIAGALGEHTDTSDLEGLGFIPAGTGARVRSVGNTSLRGAELFLVDPSLRTVSEVWTTAATHVDLTTDPAFTQNFMRHMRFIYS